MALSNLPQHLSELEFEYGNVLLLGFKKKTKAMNKQRLMPEICIHIIKPINYFNRPAFVDSDGESKKEQSVK